MPLDYLREIANTSLPLKVEDVSHIDLLRVLSAAELIVAQLPEPYSERQEACVYGITTLGRLALRRRFGE